MTRFRLIVDNFLMQKISVDEAYSSEPWWYDVRGFFILTFAYRTTLPSQVKLFANNLKAHHLEVAIGSGTLFDLILKWRRWKNLPPVEISAFDYAKQMLLGARKRFSRFKNISLIQADAANLPFNNDQFESANIANAIHCLPEISKSLQEIFRVLKPGGTLAGNCLLYPTGNGIFDRVANRINDWGTRKGILNRPYEASEVRLLLHEAGFVFEFEEISGNCLNFIVVKP